MLPLVGSYYRNVDDYTLRNTLNNPICMIVKDDHNKHDPNAMRVYALDGRERTRHVEWLHVGYIQRHSALKIMKFLEQNDIDFVHNNYIIGKPVAIDGEWFVSPKRVKLGDFQKSMNTLYRKAIQFCQEHG